MKPKHVITVEKSQNSKTGEVSTTYVSQQSCPSSCPLLGSGCYAESGMVGIHTHKLNNAGKATPLELAREEAHAIDGLSGTRAMRLHVVGDCSTPRAALTVSSAAMRYTAKFRQSVWSYTHAWREVPRKNWQGVSILASCESIADAATALNAGYAPAVVIASHTTPKARRDATTGINMIPCPAQTKNVQCTDCKLCWRADWLVSSRSAITFAAHGSSTKRVREKLIQISACV